ncbi:hypothetical protein [Flavobacterium stagni]|uniref:Uncharacterized protein n=1 Tax=Flavobacterium stagni TaxID=2506421 RepID=A0A4Q1KCK5_9FLAO|nr:hypothetical protein [Flavobacterium stagni]RXR24672.1 hypothetical protein EQG61_04290 [Flavobacterium stagni]
MSQKFFKILDSLLFSELSESEQKAMLIQTKVYVKGNSTPIELNLEDGEILSNSYGSPKYIGLDFEFNEVNYKLNDDFLSEVFNECIKCFKSHHIPLIDNQIETLNLQADFSGDRFVEEMRQKEINNYNTNLSIKLFKKLHYLGFENEQAHLDIMKTCLSLNWVDLSDYLFGLNNIPNFHILHNYYNYVRLNRVLLLLVSKLLLKESDENNNIKFSRPKFIAMLNELGFFKWELIKDLTNVQKAKVILALMQQDYENENAIHNVVKNIQTLNSKSELNNKKYTAWTHMEAVKMIICKITNKS